MTALDPKRDCCTKLLSEALDLCVRARNIDAIIRRQATLETSSDADEWQTSGRFDQHVCRHNALYPDPPIHTQSATMPLWYQEQYEKDVAEWERRTRHHLTQEHPS